MLAERFRESADLQQKQNTILVLPFQNFGQTGESPLYGYALADAIAARLARMSSLVVRPSSSLMQLPVPMQQMDPLSVPIMQLIADMNAEVCLAYLLLQNM